MNANFTRELQAGATEADVARNNFTTEEVVRLVTSNYAGYERFPAGFPKCSSRAIRSKIIEQTEHLRFEQQVEIIGAKNVILGILSSTLAQRESRLLNIIVASTAIGSVVLALVSIFMSSFALSASGSAQAASSAETERHALVIKDKLEQIAAIPSSAPISSIGNQLDALAIELQKVTHAIESREDDSQSAIDEVP